MLAIVSPIWADIPIPAHHHDKDCREFVAAYQDTKDQQFVVWLLASEDKSGRLTSTLYHIVRNVADAQDVAQELFLSLRKKLLRHDPLSNCPAWLRTIVKNAALDFIKGKKRRGAKEEAVHPKNTGSDERSLRDLQLDAEKMRPAMQQAVAGVENGWEIIIKKNSGKSFSQCAQELGITFTQFRGRYQRADKILQKKFGKDYHKFLILDVQQEI